MAPFAEFRHRRSVHGGGNNSDNLHPTPWATMSYNHAQRARLSNLHGSKRNPIYAKCLQCSGRRRVPRRNAQWEEAHHHVDGGELVAEPHAYHPWSPQLDQSFLLFRSPLRAQEWSRIVHHSSSHYRMSWGVRSSRSGATCRFLHAFRRGAATSASLHNSAG